MTRVGAEIYRERQLAVELMGGGKRGRAEEGETPLSVGARDDPDGFAVALVGGGLEAEQVARRVHDAGTENGVGDLIVT